jgi:hypothetical protein
MGEERGRTMYFGSMESSKNFPRSLKKVAAVRRESEPAWC